jgi:HlyD family secretion protein
MKSKLYVSLLVLALILASGAFALRGRAKASAPSAASHSAAGPSLIAAPGRVEPLSEEIKLGSEINGKIKTLLVEEGDRVKRGQLIAVLENDDYRAQVASAEAQLAQSAAELRKTINGARTEERREALAAVNEGQAVMENARADMERRQRLFQAGVIAREEADRYEREYKVAKARHDAEQQHFTLVDEQTREEDRSKAEAAVSLARAQLEEARARYEKTFIRSPIDGVILRKLHRAGESVTNSATSPDPIVTLGDQGVLRVRVDVDETDVGKLRLGQNAFVTAEAFGNRKFWGRIVRIGQELGRKNVRTDEPSERVDTKILETLIELDDGHELPVGLRVDAFIVAQASPPLSGN